VSEDWRPAGRVVRRGRRALGALLLSCSLVGLVACGFNAQTNQPYTPADGTNADIGESGILKVRNLVVVSREEGQGIVSASIVANEEDTLDSVTVAPFKADGTDAPAATASLPTPMRLTPGSLTILTNGPLLTVEASDLTAGLDALVTMQFEKAGAVNLRAPVVDGTLEPWSSISATPSAGASESPSPSPSATS